MIDYEVDIYDEVVQRVREVFPKGKLEISADTIKKPAKLPYMSIEEINNYTDERSMTADDGDKFAVVTYDVNVYTNDISGKKLHAKRILAVADEAFVSLNFRRVQKDITPNLSDATVYRITARYRAIVGDDGKLYRR